MVLCADQLLKYLLVANFAFYRSCGLGIPFARLTLIKNYGSAFSIIPRFSPLFTVLSLAALAGIAYLFFNKAAFNRNIAIAAGLILGGGAGNLLDRARLGYVIDYIDFRIWPVFNLADAAITAGASLLIIHILLSSRKRHKQS